MSETHEERVARIAGLKKHRPQTYARLKEMGQLELLRPAQTIPIAEGEEKVFDKYEGDFQ